MINHLAAVFFILSGLLHIGFFLIESYFFQKSDGYKYFKIPKENHAPTKIWALNQGFYNLFLAIGILVGIYLISETLILFCAISMIGAGIVLWFSAPQLRRGALIQMIPPLMGIIFWFLPRM